jgi:NADH-quinone oxidoreductase subunit L
MSLVWLAPALPLLGFLILVIGWKMPARAASLIGAGSVGLAMLAAIGVCGGYLLAPPEGGAFTLTIWKWVGVNGFSVDVSLTLDALSVVMVLLVTVVGFLIHLYSVRFMEGGEGYARFFAYMNLFVASMLILVLADNLFLLYLGWEGVGLCSFLLIGFWHADPANGRAARKAFIVTRIGDVSLMIGLFIIALNLGSLGISDVSRKALEQWASGSGIAVLTAFLILGGAVGKSAQLPLQTWLPDAMAGPSPVSALIHAATMVTAGVYLIARTNVLFRLAPEAMFATAVVGAATLFVAGASAAAQKDIKRILAYSTISQLGYMFLALGVGAWSGAIFHLVTHAFFKSLLFLAAGVVIIALHEEHDIFSMGGLSRKMPFTFWVFLIGAFGLTALPPVTSGFSSKDLILEVEWGVGGVGRLFWVVALSGVFLTSLYTFRMVFMAFFGPARDAGGPRHESPASPDMPPYKGTRVPVSMMISLGALAALCLVGGLLNFPKVLGGSPYLTGFLDTALPVSGPREGGGLSEIQLELISLAASLAGIPVAYLAYRRSLRRHAAVSGAAFGRAAVPAEAKGFWRFFLKGWGFDFIYDLLFVRPFVWISRMNKKDVINTVSEGVGAANMLLSKVFRSTQTGRIRWYAAGLAAGGLLIIAAVVAL